MRKHIDFEVNPSILNDFLLYLLNTKNYSISTIKTYELDLIIFFKFVIEYKNIKTDLKRLSLLAVLQVSQKDIIAFLVYLSNNRNNCAYTRKRRISAIRSFYKWLLLTTPSVTQENPTKNINIEPNFRLPKYLSLNQAKQIQNIFTIKNSQMPVRNNAIISLFLSTGIRMDELIKINIEDINFNDNSINIVGKGNKQRKVYFSNYCKAKLLRYIEFRNKNKKNLKQNALFINLQHKRVGKDCIRSICKKAYRLMDLEKYGYTVHSLRHTAATIMYKHTNCDILLLKEFLGHERITTTMIYTHIFNSNVKSAVDNNPLNKLEKIA